MPLTRKLLLLIAGLALAVPAFASGLVQDSGRDHSRNHDRGRDQGDDRDRERDDDDRGGSERRITLDEAMAQAERRYKARAVHGEEKRQGDRIVYRIRLLDQDGRVFEVSMDAGSSRDK